jgi:hypothetical protein
VLKPYRAVELRITNFFVVCICEVAEDWSNIEVEIIVQDYFKMLAEEAAGRPFNKAAHKRAILPLLSNRSESSVEFKHRNISAVLEKLGGSYIYGYKPLWNYQKLLEEIVVDYLKRHPEVEAIFKQFAESVPVDQSFTFLFDHDFIEGRPEKRLIVHDPDLVYKNPLKINYIELEQANAQIGYSGERIVIEYERWRLIQEGKDALAHKIEWVSQTDDSAGFDILSKNPNGTDRYIEVKSTKLTKEAPIYFSKNEYDFSVSNKSNYYLYRVFNLKQAPKMFIAQGTFDDFCNPQAVKFKGYF